MLTLQSQSTNATLLYTERVAFLYRYAPLSLSVMLFAALTIALYQHRIAPSYLLLSWFVFMVMVMFSLMLLVYRYHRRQMERSSTSHWGNSYVYGICLIALGWAVVVLLFLPDQVLAQQLFYAFIVMAVTITTVPVLAVIPPVAVLFLLLPLLPLAMQFYRQGDALSVICALFSVLVIGGMLLTIRVSHQVIVRTFHLQRENNLLHEAEQHLLTQVEEQSRQLKQLANYDFLTQLPNRESFHSRLQQAIDNARHNGTKTAVLFLDLDRFKFVNQSLGQTAGDALLQLVADRLLHYTGKSDTVGRLGSDEFALLLEEVADSQQTLACARQLLEVMNAPFILDSDELFVSCSIGISIYPDHGTDASTLLQTADMAVRRVKVQGRNEVEIYSSEMNIHASDRIKLTTELRRAIENDELVLYYQPQGDLSNGKIIGLEALVRWPHPQQGLLLPGEFIPIAEETGLITALDDWVLNSACAQLVTWQDAGLPAMWMAVNLSARYFMHAELVQRISRVLAETSLATEYLELEITESLLMQDAQRTVATLHELKATGLHLAIDDFGTGYSSLSYLQRFPIDWLKIDRVFIQNIISDPGDAAIASAVIAMAHRMKINVIAEGVETEAQLNLLRSWHCDAIQGFYLSRPLPAEQLAAWMQNYSSHQLIKPNSLQRTVLLVDDDESALELSKAQLGQDGYQILTAINARQGLELMANNSVDIVVADYRMPEMDGVEFLRRISALYPDTVRIMLSGASDSDVLAQAVNEGAIFRFLFKPIARERMRQTLHEAFLIQARRAAPES